MNILFIRDIMTKNPQTYLNKNCIKKHGIQYSRWGVEEISGNFRLYLTNFFPKKKIRVKLKNLMNTWVTKGIENSSKKKEGAELHLPQKTMQIMQKSQINQLRFFQT